MRAQYDTRDKFDFIMFTAIVLLVLIGFVAIYSSTQNTVTEQNNIYKQVTFWFVSLAVFSFIYSIPLQTIRTYIIPLYSASVFFLILVLFLGKVVGGAKSWIPIGPFSFQPSEMAKVTTILALATFMSRPTVNIDNFKDLGYALGIGLLPVALILLEPDMGSSLVFFSLILFMIFWKGISLFSLFVVLSPGIVALASLFGLPYMLGSLTIVLAVLVLVRKDIFFSGSIFALNLSAAYFVDEIYSLLSPHQQKRIMTFIDPTADPLGSGYNSLQAIIAVGSGGLLGQGFLEGNQTQLQFIPEQWTDFIFCVIGEEFGFIGAIIVILLYSILFIRLIRIARITKDEFSSLVTVGILIVMFTHFFINVGMVIGVLPVIGIPLPFLSYGGSSLLSNMIMMGLVMNIYRNLKV
ncbi:MAG: rod shape-determining protein RodA [Ignavibacteriaceae bacterium]|nr:rod shape-determining protein RodA [Ignavibacteriaceae bacterium]